MFGPHCLQATQKWPHLIISCHKEENHLIVYPFLFLPIFSFFSFACFAIDEAQNTHHVPLPHCYICGVVWIFFIESTKRKKCERNWMEWPIFLLVVRARTVDSVLMATGHWGYHFSDELDIWVWFICNDGASFIAECMIIFILIELLPRSNGPL